MDFLLPLFLIIPFAGALSLLAFPRERLPLSFPRLVTLAVTAVTLGILSVLTSRAFGAETPPEYFLEWMPAVGLHVSLWLDGPALFYAWIVAGIGFLVFYYAGYYMDPSDDPWRFYGVMMMFMGSMLGVVVSRNALLMFLFWELTSITSFLLIGHWHRKKSAREGALRALIVTGLGGLCLLAGIAATTWILTSEGVSVADNPRLLDWDVLWANADILTAHPAAMTALVLLLLGAFTKSAQFPFQFWLPGAMEAPTPVSAYLHAATMVKAGIYLLGRLYPVFSGMEAWLLLVGGIGCLTMLVGGVVALLSHDLKQLLAHSTVSQLGLLTAYYGFGYHMAGTEHPLPLDLLLVGSHAFFKGGLFMLVGVIDHGTHTRDWTRLGGLFRKMPATAILTMIGCASMAGVPLTFGFVAKEMFLHASLHLHTETAWIAWGFPGLAIFSSIFTVAYCVRTAVSPFFGAPRDPSIHAHEGSVGFLAAPALLIGLCLFGGLYVPLLEAPIATMVNGAYYGLESGFQVAFYHHVDVLFWISMFLFTTGAIAFALGTRFEAVYTAIGRPALFGGAYSALFNDWVPGAGRHLARLVQSPRLSRNTLLSFSAFVFLVIAAALVAGFRIPAPEMPVGVEWLAAIPVVLSLASLYVVLTCRIAVARLVAMAPIGLFVAIFFVFFKAPDLALTQILVEVVVLVVLLLAIFRLPQRIDTPERVAGTGARVGVSLLGGAVMAFVCYTGLNSPWREELQTFDLADYPTLKEFYLQNTKDPFVGGGHGDGDHGGHGADDAAAMVSVAQNYPGAESPHSGGGRNAVNVILVDFRGIDTMGEITVLGIAAMGVLVLLMVGRADRLETSWKEAARADVAAVGEVRHEGRRPPRPPYRPYPNPSLFLSETGRIVPAFVLLFAVALFFAGHNAPGGGFIAGLMTSVGLLTIKIAFSPHQYRDLTRLNFGRLIPLGLFFAVATGLAALLFDRPFLTSTFVHLQVPVLGDIELASAMVFDLGVYLLVVGVTMLIIQRLGEE